MSKLNRPEIPAEHANYKALTVLLPGRIFIYKKIFLEALTLFAKYDIITKCVNMPVYILLSCT